MSDEDFNWREAFDLPEPDPNRTWGRSHTKAGWKLYDRGDYKRGGRFRQAEPSRGNAELDARCVGLAAIRGGVAESKTLLVAC